MFKLGDTVIVKSSQAVAIIVNIDIKPGRDIYEIDSNGFRRWVMSYNLEKHTPEAKQQHLE